MEVKRIFEEGVLIDLTIGIWSGRATLEAKDLGLDPANVPAIFKLGQKLLVDGKAMTSIIQVVHNARNVLRMWGFQFPVGQAAFIPKGSLAAVIDRLDVFEKAFGAEVEKFVGNYETVKSDMLAKFPENKEALEAYYPIVGKLRDSFHFTYSIFTIANPDAGGPVTEGHQQMMAQKFAEFTDKVVTTLREETTFLFQGVADRLAKGEVVRKDTFAKIIAFIDRFNILNFLNDAEVARKLEDIKGHVNGFLTGGRDQKIDVDAREAFSASIKELVAVAGTIHDLDSVTGGLKRRIMMD